MTIDNNTQIFFDGKTMTIKEFATDYEVEDLSQDELYELLQRLEQKNQLRFLNDSTSRADESFEIVEKQVNLEEQIEILEKEEKEAEMYRVKKRREGQLRFEEVEIDFPSQLFAEDFRKYAEEKLHVEASVDKVDDMYVLTLKDITERELGALRRRKLIAETESAIYRGTALTSKGIVDVTSFATEKIVTPTAKAVTSATLGVTKSVIKTTTQVGSSLVSSTAENIRNTKDELARDRDVLEAKSEIVKAKDAIVGFFKRKRGNSGVRIK